VQKRKSDQNTRANARSLSEQTAIASEDRHLLCVLDLAGLRRCSLLGINFSQTCSHLIHTPLPFLPAAGLRLEIASNCDKEKSELYFSFSVKKILTENQNQRVPSSENFSICTTHDRLRWRRHFLCFTTLVMSSCAFDSTCRAF